MSANNSALVIGRLTSDVEVRKTQSGLSVASFALAVQGRQKNEVDFIDCVAWRQSADFLGQFARKGDMISVSGQLKTSTYERNGQNIKKTEVVSEDVKLLAHKANQNTNEGKPIPVQNAPQTAQNQPSEWNGGIEFSEDDLPF